VDETQARKNLYDVCRLAYARGYICGTEGNFSIRLGDDLLIATAAGTCKGRVEPDQFVVTDMAGQRIESKNYSHWQPSTELAMHLTVYQARPDVRAVAHAHPTVAVGFTVAGVPLTKCVLPEVVCSLGVIPTAPYATPSTSEVSAGIEQLIKQYDAVMLDHHGALTCGADLWQAFHKMETVEHYAQTMLVAHMLGGVKPLYSSQVKTLLSVRSIYGFNNPLPEEFLTGSECSLPDPESAN
jgi:L-fuculose-phosphate aldolase